MVTSNSCPITPETPIGAEDIMSISGDSTENPDKLCILDIITPPDSKLKLKSILVAPNGNPLQSNAKSIVKRITSESTNVFVKSNDGTPITVSVRTGPDS